MKSWISGSVGWGCSHRFMKREEENMKGPMVVFVMVLAAALSLSTPGRGSIDRGGIRGTVTDQQGGVIPGARVVVKNVDTNVQVSSTTNTAGFYLASELVP